MNSQTPLTIFLADDDEDDRYIFNDALKSLQINANLVCFAHCSDLLEHLSTNILLPDLVFLDINMPILSGKECLKRIRNELQLRHIPVIMYSTSSNVEDIDETFIAGADLYIAKPFTYKLQVTMFEKLFAHYFSKGIRKGDRASFQFNYHDE